MENQSTGQQLKLLGDGCHTEAPDVVLLDICRCQDTMFSVKLTIEQANLNAPVYYFRNLIRGGVPVGCDILCRFFVPKQQEGSFAERLIDKIPVDAVSGKSAQTGQFSDFDFRKL